MRKFTTIGVCDDEPETQKQVYNFIQEYIQLHQRADQVQTYVFSTAQQLLARKEPLDLLYLDIKLGEDSGLDLVPQLQRSFPEITIIFISCYSKYFIYSHRLHVFQFLTKPFDKVIFFEELDRFFAKQEQKKAIYKINFKWEQFEFPTQEIIFIKSSLRYLSIYHGKTGFHEKIGQIGVEETQLRSYGFIRCHHSYLVNARYIKDIKNQTVYMQNPFINETFEIPVSRKRVTHTKQTYQDWLLEQEL